MMLMNMIFKRAYKTNVNTIQWNKMLRTHQTNGDSRKALKLFEMGIEKRTFQPNAVTYLTMLDICKELKDINTVRTIHQLIDASKRTGDDNDVHRSSHVRSLLMDVYIKCQDLDSACRVFDSMFERNLVDYCSLMTGLNAQERFEDTLELCSQMSPSLRSSSPVVYTLALQACTALNRFDIGRQIHLEARRFLPQDKTLMNQLLDFYLKSNDEYRALKIFEQLNQQQSLIDYSSLMKFYNRNQQTEKTLELYRRLLKNKNSHLQPDHIIFVLVTQAIAHGCCLQTSKDIHRDTLKFGTNIDVNNALINMYGKLADLATAEKIFNSMTKHNIVSYNVLLNLYGLYRQSDKALACYTRMRQQGYRPDDKTHVLLLHALSQTSSKMNDVRRIFSGIDEKQRGPMLTATMVAAFVRAQLWDDAIQLIKNSPRDNFLFCAAKANLTVENDDRFDFPISMTDDQLTVYDLLMSSMYSLGGFHDRWTSVDEFFYGNESLKNSLSTAWLEQSNGCIKYFKGTSPSQSCAHSEQLALDFAQQQPALSSVPVLIGKNQRMCHECHEYFKKISSSFAQSKIILRDCTRFHLFSKGICSCEISC